jgi:glucose-6-phosphate 1-dehydrogenase
MEVSPIPNTIVIFGASGDLAHRKLLPALYNLYRRDLLHERSRIIGCARSHMDDDAFRSMVRERMPKCISELCGRKLDAFLAKLSFVSGPYDEPSTYAKLSAKIAEIEQETCCGAGRVYYLSTPSSLHAPIVSMLGAAGWSRRTRGRPWRNVVIEKPIGRTSKRAQLDNEQRAILPNARSTASTTISQGDRPEHPEAALRKLDLRPVLDRNYITRCR